MHGCAPCSFGNGALIVSQQIRCLLTTHCRSRRLRRRARYTAGPIRAKLSGRFPHSVTVIKGKTRGLCIGPSPVNCRQCHTTTYI
ncbi:hypothetical protein MYA_3192 [Burkholderia sp. KJ006]|nr:hypothetical protein MYA_3192 [Burkholderia sp. KJ006]